MKVSHLRNLTLPLLLLFASCENKNQNNGGGNFHGGVYLSRLFDVEGASSVALTNNAIGEAANSGEEKKMENDIVKILENGEYDSIFKVVDPSWNLRISVMELGPDGSLFVGLDWGIWIHDDMTPNKEGSIQNFSHSPAGKNVAFFQIKKDGETQIVDPDIHGMGQFYNKEFLAKKQIQFDSEGSIFYLGKQGQTTVLKKKTTAGAITQIGNSRMEVRDFLVANNGTVIFNGANRGDWETQWLRLFNKDGSVTNVYYREGSGWLRTYYLDKNQNLILVGDNLKLITHDGQVGTYSGIVRANLKDGKVLSFTHLVENFQLTLNGDNIYFGAAGQLLLSDTGSMYAVISSYDWTNGNSTDKIFRILDDEQNLALHNYPTHPHFPKVKLARLIGDNLIYLSSANGVSGIVKVGLTGDGVAEDLTEGRDNIEIFNFAYHPKKKELFYDVYDLRDNTSYVVQQDVASSIVLDELRMSGMNITDILPFVYSY